MFCCFSDGLWEGLVPDFEKSLINKGHMEITCSLHLSNSIYYGGEARTAQRRRGARFRALATAMGYAALSPYPDKPDIPTASSRILPYIANLQWHWVDRQQNAGDKRIP